MSRLDATRFDHPFLGHLFFRSLPALISLSLLFWGCSSRGSTQPTPPAIPTFTTVDPPGVSQSGFASGTYVTGINASGTIAGYFFDSRQSSHGFIRSSSGAFTVFDPPNTFFAHTTGTQISAINGSGAVTGSFTSENMGRPGFIRTPDGSVYVFENFSNLGSITPLSIVPMSINDNGEITGYFFDQNRVLRGFTGSVANGLTAFDAPDAFRSASGGTLAFHVNANGEIVGSYTDANSVQHGFLRHGDGTFTVLDAPGADSTQVGTLATQINMNGSITGWTASAQTSHSFVRTQDGTYSVFDPPDADASGSTVRGINSSGMIIGAFSDTNSVGHGFLRSVDGSSFITIDDPEAGLTPTVSATTPTNINDTGAIVGYFRDATGAQHGFLRQ